MFSATISSKSWTTSTSTHRYFQAVDLNHHEICHVPRTGTARERCAVPISRWSTLWRLKCSRISTVRLGRRLRFKGGQRLRLFPHAFHARNAYFDRKILAVLFGYFRADEDDPGRICRGSSFLPAYRTTS